MSKCLKPTESKIALHPAENKMNSGEAKVISFSCYVSSSLLEWSVSVHSVNMTPALDSFEFL